MVAKAYNPVMDFPREWTAFGGASLALMGAAIAAGARRHAEDNLAWQREWRRAVGAPDSGAGDARNLVLGYRAGGALGFLAGLGFLAAAAMGRSLTSSHFALGDARALGACFALLGGAFAMMRLFRRAPRGPRFLIHEPLAASDVRPLDERAATAASWALIVLWIWFGLRLILESTR
jgi:hypothetical protein